MQDLRYLVGGGQVSLKFEVLWGVLLCPCASVLRLKQSLKVKASRSFRNAENYLRDDAG
jgi:hypothetical protein